MGSWHPRDGEIAKLTQGSRKLKSISLWFHGKVMVILVGFSGILIVKLVYMSNKSWDYGV